MMNLNFEISDPTREVSKRTALIARENLRRALLFFSSFATPKLTAFGGDGSMSSKSVGSTDSPSISTAGLKQTEKLLLWVRRKLRDPLLPIRDLAAAAAGVAVVVFASISVDTVG